VQGQVEKCQGGFVDRVGIDIHNVSDVQVLGQ
jgi:hypothetical protein